MFLRTAFRAAHVAAFCPRQSPLRSAAGVAIANGSQLRRMATRSNVKDQEEVNRIKDIRDVACEYVKPKMLSRYMSLSPWVLDDESSLLAGMKASTVDVICTKPHVRAIRLGDGAMYDPTVLAGDTIYERSFFPQLVKDMRTARKRVLLLGNRGVGTSTFQFYLLARYMNPEQFQDIGSAPPDGPIQFGSAAPPKVVIRHLPGEFQVLFLEKCVAHSVSSQAVLRCFDPATTLYFYEPGSTATTEPLFESHALPMLVTSSPNSARYKEYSVRSAAMHWPLYDAASTELLAIGQDMRQTRGFPSDLVELYSDDNIDQRLKDFNVIFRYVLPHNACAATAHLDDIRTFAYIVDPLEFATADLQVMLEHKTGPWRYDVQTTDDDEWDFLASPGLVLMMPALFKEKFAEGDSISTKQSADRARSVGRF